jgi:hypothetical protein
MKVYVIKYDCTNIDLRLDGFDVKTIEKDFKNEYYIVGNGKEAVFLDFLDCILEDGKIYFLNKKMASRYFERLKNYLIECCKKGIDYYYKEIEIQKSRLEKLNSLKDVNNETI